MNQGRVLAAFGHRRILEKPPSGGVSVCSESVGVPPELMEPPARELLRAPSDAERTREATGFLKDYALRILASWRPGSILLTPTLSLLPRPVGTVEPGIGVVGANDEERHGFRPDAQEYLHHRSTIGRTGERARGAVRRRHLGRARECSDERGGACRSGGDELLACLRVSGNQAIDQVLAIGGAIDDDGR